MITFAELEETPDTFYKNENLQIKIGDKEFERGKLLLSPNNISLKLNSQENGIIIPWGTITVQAITQDFPRSVYFMIDVNINLFNGEQRRAAQEIQVDEPMNGENGNENGHDDSDEGNGSVDSDHNITEFWLLPDLAEAVDEIYHLMTKYPENPPRNESDEEEDDDEFLDFDGNDVGDDMAQMQIDDNEQFADALE